MGCAPRPSTYDPHTVMVRGARRGVAETGALPHASPPETTRRDGQRGQAGGGQDWGTPHTPPPTTHTQSRSEGPDGAWLRLGHYPMPVHPRPHGETVREARREVAKTGARPIPLHLRPTHSHGQRGQKGVAETGARPTPLYLRPHTHIVLLLSKHCKVKNNNANLKICQSWVRT